MTQCLPPVTRCLRGKVYLVSSGPAGTAATAAVLLATAKALAFTCAQHMRSGFAQMFSLLHKSPGIIIIVRCYLYTDDTPVVPTILKTVMLQK